MKQKVLFIGDCALGNETTNGVSAKNHFLLKRLQAVCDDVINIDTANWKRRPKVLLKLLGVLVRYPEHNIIISLNTLSAYRFIKTINKFFPKRRLNYFVIGGVLGHWLKTQKLNRKPYGVVDHFMVETIKMKKEMAEAGFENVITLPNFKDIPATLPQKRNHKGPVRFVFLSRIIPEKGCEYILDAIKLLNAEEMENKFCVNFYGVIDDNYKNHFEERLKFTPNAAYLGFMDLKEKENYQILAENDVMLFPTYWSGEGFPGIIIDAYIAGLPIIATKWAHNEEVIKDGETGMLIPAHDVKSLCDKMLEAITHPEKIAKMSNTCQQEANNYHTDNILSETFLYKILGD